MFEKKSLMSRRRQEPTSLLRQMTAELDRMFDDPWTLSRWPSDVATLEAPMWAPRVDVVTKDNKLVTRVDLPGMKKEDVLVEVEDGLLTLSGERQKETKEEKDNVYREEREYGSFCRTLPLPKGVKADDVKATFANGVLEVTVPLPAAAARNGRKIPIQDATPAKTAA
jgi:HSP20 family protein